MSELVDLVDADGQIQAEAIPIGDIDEHPDLHLPIAVAVIFNGLEKVVTHRRHLSKRVNPGCLDFVCGVVSSGEKPHETAPRESKEETGVVPLDLELIAQGVNQYGRYRSLFVGRTEQEEAAPTRPNEAEWAAVMPISEVRWIVNEGMLPAVGDLIAHLDMALDYHRARQAA